MSRKQSISRGVAALSSGAVVVGAGAAVGVLAAYMSEQWSGEAALQAAAAQVVADPVVDVSVPRPVVITRIEERHITPEAVVVLRKVYVRVPARQGSAPRAQAAPQRQPTRSVAKAKPSRTVIAPAPAPAARKAAPSASKAKSKTS
jgi:hypothetical protein